MNVTTSLPLEPDNEGSVHVRTLFISDVHLGTRGCQAEKLLEFLRYYEADTDPEAQEPLIPPASSIAVGRRSRHDFPLNLTGPYFNVGRGSSLWRCLSRVLASRSQAWAIISSCFFCSGS